MQVKKSVVGKAIIFWRDSCFRVSAIPNIWTTVNLILLLVGEKCLEKIGWYVPGGLTLQGLCTKRFRLEFQSLALLYNIFDRKGTLFVYFLLKWYPFHTPSLEICITDLRTPSSIAIREIPTFSLASALKKLLLLGEASPYRPLQKAPYQDMHFHLQYFRVIRDKRILIQPKRQIRREKRPYEIFFKFVCHWVSAAVLRWAVKLSYRDLPYLSD